ncbi:excinuclease ABC subunit UvrC, partial [Rickettsiales bacterium]|nr:excinuclease ABC subunit UvrC [Rickettsiales bacterium]
KIKKSPKKSAIYKFFDNDDNIIYIGKAKNLNNRLKNYLDSKNLTTRITKMTLNANNIEWIITNNEIEALLLECNLIKKYKPKYNILLKDSKSFPYIAIAKNHDFPKLSKYRGFKDNKSHYFGPFASISAMDDSIESLKKAFLLRSCSDTEFNSRKRPCLEYEIKRCSAPCVGLILKEEYQKSIIESINFLKGKSSNLQEELSKKMQEYSDDLQFEKAAKIRDRIKSLSLIQAKQNISIKELGKMDIILLSKKSNIAAINISFYRFGNNYGNKTYFFDINSDDKELDIIFSFISQFYKNHEIPKNIISNIDFSDNKEIKELLRNFNITNSQSDIAINHNFTVDNINIFCPKRGQKLQLIKDALPFLEEEINKKIASNSKIKDILLQLKNLLHINHIPNKIEIYDNSHISGTNIVGAMVFASEDGFVKSNYRKFNIKLQDLTKKDDTNFLKQVFNRRFKDFENQKIENLPNLIIIDGGKGQLSAIKNIFDKKNIKIPFLCMSKGAGRNAGLEDFHIIDENNNYRHFNLSKNSAISYYLQNLRDEAHRFAIGTHIARRKKSMFKSQLDEIPNIGSSRKKLLLNHFGNLESIKNASLEDLMRVKNLGNKMAQQIFNFFNDV